MANCSQCGSSIPDGQKICSMCMGDINHGNDGHYQRWAEEQNRRQEERQQSEREDYDRECDKTVREGI